LHGDQIVASHLPLPPRPTGTFFIEQALPEQSIDLELTFQRRGERTRLYAYPVAGKATIPFLRPGRHESPPRDWDDVIEFRGRSDSGFSTGTSASRRCLRTIH